jgi:hypothetical protein
MIEIYEDDDLTPVTDLAIPNLEAGEDSDTLTLHLWADKGNPAGQDESDVLLLVETEDPTTPGRWLRSGLAPQEEMWARARLVGHDNSDRPEQQPLLTDWQLLGASAGLVIPTLLAGAARYLQIKWRPPSTASATAYRFRLLAVVGGHSLALPAGGPGQRGILTGLGERGHSGLVRGGAVTASGTPDDEVHVAAAAWVHLGEAHSKVASSHTLSQQDAAAASLASGQSYLAVLSLGTSGVVVTKGAKAPAPVRPATPAGHIELAVVAVQYGASGSVIEGADITPTAIYDRHYAEPGTGLELRVHGGRAVGGGTYRYHSQVQELALPSSATRYLWQLASGAWELTATTAAPQASALGPLWAITTDGTGITALVDRRSYLGGSVALTLAGEPSSTGVLASLRVAQHLVVERWYTSTSDDGSGTGSTILRYEINGADAFPGAGDDDQRPTWAVGASVLTADDAYPELLELWPGDLLELVIDALPSTPPARVEATWLCREV